MNEFDIPIFKKTYNLYKLLHEYRRLVPKQDRFTLWQKCEEAILDVIQGIIKASSLSKTTKMPTLDDTSLHLNVTRVFIRLMKDTKVLDQKKYIALEGEVDEIGRMLGGWIRSLK